MLVRTIDFPQKTRFFKAYEYGATDSSVIDALQRRKKNQLRHDVYRCDRSGRRWAILPSPPSPSTWADLLV